MARRILDRREAPAIVAAGAPDDPAPARVIVASARRIDLADRKATVKALGKRASWQDDAWLVFHAIGEVKYADRFLANGIGRLRLFPAVRPEADQAPVPIADSDLSDTAKAAAQDALDRIKAERGGQSAILSAITLGLEVAGECFLLGYEEADEQRDAEGAVVSPARPERWEVRSTSEVIVSAEGQVQTRGGPGEQPEDVPPGTFFLRIWEPDPQWQEKPDSPLRGVLSEADELLILSRAIRAAGRSRLPAGLLLVPSELSFGNPDPSKPKPASDDDDPFAVALMEAMTAAVEDEGDPSALVPPVVRGKAEHLKELRHVLLSRPIDGVQAEQRKELLRRLAQGLNVPPEIVTGMADLNHWTAWQVDGSTFSAHMEPRALGIVDALTSGVFRSLFAAYAGVTAEDVERVFIWYDESEVVTQPNRAQDAKDAHNANVISDEALRKALGFSDADAPSAEELARRTGLRRGIFDGPITETLLAYLLGPKLVEDVEAIRQSNAAIETTATDTTAPAGEMVPDVTPPSGDGEAPTEGGPPPADGDGEPAEAVAASAAPNVGERLARIDTDLFTRVRLAADASLARTLERAGARLRSRVQRDPSARAAVANVDNVDVAATLGPGLVATLATEDELLGDDAFDGLAGRFAQWVETAQRQALDLAQREWGVADARRAEVETAMAADRDEAWTWLRGALLDLAREHLYGRASVTAAAGPRRTTATLIGEADPTLLMPAGTIREALARAGGASGMEVAATPAGGVALRTQAGTLPAGGVATGQVLINLADENGRTVAWYTWRHGSPPHPFAPHARLDGVRFYGQGDANVAADLSEFPFVAHYEPGDHRGCTCIAEPYFGPRTAEAIG